MTNGICTVEKMSTTSGRMQDVNKMLGLAEVMRVLEEAPEMMARSLPLGHA
jgi:hypothetical protein